MKIFNLSVGILTAFYKNTSDSVVAMLGNTTYRMHRFRTSASPVKGLTADILVCMNLSSLRIHIPILFHLQIKTAEIAYGRPASYERYAPTQLKSITDIVKVIVKS